MNPRSIFPSGLDLANLVINSNLLNHSLAAISALKAEIDPFQPQQQSLSLKWRTFPLLNSIIVAFVTFPSSAIHHLQQVADLVPSETLKQENCNLFDFLISKSTPSFSINRAAISLFHQHLEDLSHIKNQLVDWDGKLLLEKSLVITGDSLGGSVAALFTLWLLDSINQPSKRKRPLCITFGSPLIGDLGLQKAVAECSSWTSCFLNVAAIGDPIPTLFLSQTSASAPDYKPFGAFLLCSESGCTCVDDPEQVSLLLEAMSLQSRLSQIAEEQLLLYYGSSVDNLKTRLLYKGNSLSGFGVSDPLQSIVTLQLVAIGDTRIQQQPQQDAGIATLIRKFKESEERISHNKRSTMSPSKKLHTTKIKMACLERYKMNCAEKKIGYYDSYKNYIASNHLSTSDIEIAKHKKFLSKYWIEKVEEAAKRPQKEGLHIRLTWLFAGMHYRRMVEPLDIAEYYGKGKTNYEQERSKHYVLLEKWQNEGVKRPADGQSGIQKGNLAYKVTEDSCFWANVEEAALACRLLKDGMSSDEAKHSLVAYLKGFERYVMEQINTYVVSPDVFLEGSSFMKWWNGYKDFSSVEIRDVMMNHRYVQYWKGGFQA